MTKHSNKKYLNEGAIFAEVSKPESLGWRANDEGEAGVSLCESQRSNHRVPLVSAKNCHHLTSMQCLEGAIWRQPALFGTGLMFRQ